MTTPRPDSASPETRAAWRALSNEAVLSALQNQLGESGTIRLCNDKNRHFKIIGNARTVELYATTGLVNCGRQGSLKPCKHTNMQPERAFSRAVTLAQQGW